MPERVSQLRAGIVAVVSVMTLVSLRSTPISSAQSDGPLLRVETSPLALSGSEPQPLRLRNAGTTELRWTVSAKAPWVHSTMGALAVEPLSNSTAAQGLAPGQTVDLALHAETAGLTPGPHEGTLLVTSNGGVAEVPVRLDVTVTNLSGTWVGAFVRPEGTTFASPVVALQVTQTGTTLSAKLDAIRSPAFATAITRQATTPVFEAAEGSEAAGRMSVTHVADTGVPQRWTLVARNDTQFELQGLSTGVVGLATVGQPFTSAEAGLTLIVARSANGRAYRRGDRFIFEVGSFGAVPTPLSGPLSGEIAATWPLDSALHGVPKGATRTLRLWDMRLERNDVLVARFELRHDGILSNRTILTPRASGTAAVAPGIVKLVREP